MKSTRALTRLGLLAVGLGVGATTTTAAAAESGGHLTDLLSGSSGAAADASNLWTELLSAFDGGSAAADASNLWTELASLF
jgi:hypothetical protein